MSAPETAFFTDSPGLIDWIYGMGRKQQIGQITDLYPHVVTGSTFDSHHVNIHNLQVIFSTWGMPCLNAEQIASLPNLKAVLYAGGSVRSFAAPFLEKGIHIVNAASVNALPVAAFTLAQVLLSCKGYFRNTADCRNTEKRAIDSCAKGPGIFRTRVALLGAGKIARALIKMLQPFELQVVVYDPYLSDDEARELGVGKVSLDEAFETAMVVSNHIPDMETTRGIITRMHFSKMPAGATFINTGRGAQIIEADLIEVFSQRKDLTALLDVTWPEPPVSGSPLYTMENVHLSSHIAGSIGSEVVRMADCVIDEYRRFSRGEPFVNPVTKAMLETMA